MVLGLLITPPVPAAEWQQVWSDEFSAASIDGTRWTHEVNGWGGGNNELQYYTARPQNSFLQGGKLVIRAIKETYTGPDGTRGYTSARLNSRYKGDWLYGRMEVRAKVPDGQGTWPAAWMLPSDYAYGNWAASGEIDIMEHRGDQLGTLYTTIHYGGTWPANTYSGGTYETSDLTQAFHEYAIEWEPNAIRWYLDGNQVYSATSWWSSGGPYPAPFDKRFHMLLNLAVGGNFLPNPPADADYFPKDYVVDSVRVYQKIDSPATQSPFGAGAFVLPGMIPTAEFDRGGPDIAYHDSTSANSPGATRADEQVDLRLSGDAAAPYAVTGIEPGEWLEYAVDVNRADSYQLTARVASAVSTGAFTLKFTAADGTRRDLSATVASTGGSSTWVTQALGTLYLPAGAQTLRLSAEEPGFDISSVTIARAPQTAYPPGPQVIPGKVQMQNYDIGGQDVAYYDTTPANLAGTWRPGEAVDVGPSGDTDGANSIGYFEIGEWVEYTVSVQQSGTYSILARVASALSSADLEVTMTDSGSNETVVSGTVPITGGWNTWVSAPVGNLSLQPGTYVLRLRLTAGVTNVNFLQFTRVGPATAGDAWLILGN